MLGTSQQVFPGKDESIIFGSELTSSTRLCQRDSPTRLLPVEGFTPSSLLTVFNTTTAYRCLCCQGLKTCIYRLISSIKFTDFSGSQIPLRQLLAKMTGSNAKSEPASNSISPITTNGNWFLKDEQRVPTRFHLQPPRNH